MTTTHTPAPATDRQRSFLGDLLAKREVPADLRATLEAAMPNINKITASTSIQTLLQLPLAKPAAKPTFSAADEAAELRALLRSSSKSKYAVPTDEIGMALTNTRVSGDLLFLEVKEFRGKLFIRRLVGAPGSFSRYRIPPADAITLLRKINTDPVKYSRIFGQHYTCCGRCGADLTDETSRKLFFGPTCAKAWGIAFQ